MPNEVKDNIKKIEGVTDVNLKIVWEPPWTKDMMSEVARFELNLDGKNNDREIYE